MLVNTSMKLYCDNKVVISISNNSMQHDQTKRVKIDRHFIKEKFEAKIIYISLVPTSQQTTYILIKGLFKSNFEFLFRSRA